MEYGYAKNNWPSEGLYWPDSPIPTTASLSVQFGISCRNPFNFEPGYLGSPYESLPYPDDGTWSAGYSFTQFTGVFEASSGIRSQINSTISKISSVVTQFFEVIEKSSIGGMQFLARIDESVSILSQFLTQIEGNEEGLRNQFTVEVDKVRTIRSQFWGLVFQEHKICNQFFMDNPYTIIADGDYCKVQWPSYAWPYIHVTQFLTRTQFLVTPVERNKLNTQFAVSAKIRARFNNQIYVVPVISSPLYTSFYAPLSLFIENGRPQYNTQWNYAKANKIHTEVRWRPF